MKFEETAYEIEQEVGLIEKLQVLTLSKLALLQRFFILFTMGLKIFLKEYQKTSTRNLSLLQSGIKI